MAPQTPTERTGEHTTPLPAGSAGGLGRYARLAGALLATLALALLVLAAGYALGTLPATGTLALTVVALVVVAALPSLVKYALAAALSRRR